ncbi:MAG: DUF368 domain-containing protein [Clostridia bacterium]|nr:DUF368 domain-containing protein [Clostridia bacterium]
MQDKEIKNKEIKGNEAKEISKDNAKGDSVFSWLIRLVKGGVVGMGFIIPGLSGGAFAVIVGVYEPMIRFFANIRKDFVKNLLFFVPIGIGMLASIVLVSRVLGYFFASAEIPLLWFFIGCVLGTLPSLFQKAGEKGRKPRHVVIAVVSGALMCVLLFFLYQHTQGMQQAEGGSESILTWLLVGGIFGLSAIVPGLSSTTLIVLMGLYGAMMQGFGSLDLRVLLPIVAGVGVGFLLLSKLFNRLFDRAYAGFYHFILGLVIASTAMIVPWGGKVLESGAPASYTLPLALICVGACAAGAVLGYGMGALERRNRG